MKKNNNALNIIQVMGSFILTVLILTGTFNIVIVFIGIDFDFSEAIPLLISIIILFVVSVTYSIYSLIKYLKHK